MNVKFSVTYLEKCLLLDCRFDRMKEREKTKIKHSAARALIELQDSIPVQDDPEELTNVTQNCQFNILGSLEPLEERSEVEGPISSITTSQVDSELQKLLTENIELKEKTTSMKHTEEAFRGKDEKVKYYTGLPSFLTLMALFNFVEKFIPSGKGTSPLSKFEKLVLVLMRLRLNLPPIQDLAYRFGVSKSSVSRIFLSLIHVLYIRLKPLIYWPTREELQCTIPNEFRQYFGRKVAVIIDCFEIFIERPSNLAARAHTWSTYKHHNTVKFLIGITPQGSVSFISSAWGGRTSDKYITDHCGFLNKLLPGDLVLADRGFDIAESVGLVCAEVKIPSFMKGKSQLSPLHLEHTRKIAHVRIHVERVIGLVRNKYTILQDTIPVDFLVSDNEDVPVIDKIVTVACGLVNMCESVVSFD